MILTEQKIINEVLERLNEKVDTKIDLTDDKHLAKLEYIMLFEMNFPLSDTHEMLDRLTEKRKPGDVWKTKTGWAGLKPGEERAQYGMSDKETAQKYVQPVNDIGLVEDLGLAQNDSVDILEYLKEQQAKEQEQKAHRIAQTQGTKKDGGRYRYEL